MRELRRIAQRCPITPAEPTDIESEPGCDFFGDKFGVALYKNQTETVDSYGQQSNWAMYQRMTVAGRPAAQAVDKSATHARLCNTLFDAGGGVIIVAANEVRPGDLDECAQSRKIAELIESRIPR